MTTQVATRAELRSTVEQALINKVNRKIDSIISPEEELLRFCEANVKDYVGMDLLAFWGRHPDTRFTDRAVTGALAGKKQKVAKALKELVTSGLVDASGYNGSTLYSLTSDRKQRELTIILDAIGWDRRKAILRLLEYKRR